MRSLSFALLIAVSGACSSTTSSSSPPATVLDGGVDANGPEAKGVEILGIIDLPRTADTESLSATYYDASTRTLHALCDKLPIIVPITIAEDYASASVGKPLPITGRPGDAWDGEGIVKLGAALVVVTNETTPTIERFGLDGSFEAAVDVPAAYADQAGGNKGIESLAASSDNRFLFFANEAALKSDGSIATKTKGTTIRILRREIDGAKDVEKKYTTEPLGDGGGTGDMGVSDIAALSDHELLVLERGYQSGYGNTVRIFRVDFDEDAAILTKTLVVDIGALPSDGITHPSTQPNPILDNYEALALGPALPDGRPTLFVTSDDNGSATQVARIIVLAIPAK